MQLEPKNAIENYKGVMLCSRPGDDNTPQGPKPFCARVVPPDGLGLLPFKKPTEQKPVKSNENAIVEGNSIVEKHKKWLEGFQLQQLIRKQQSQQQREKDEQKFRAIRDQAEQDRRKAKAMKDQYTTISKNVMNILDEDTSKPKEAKLNAENLRKLNELALQSEQQERPPIAQPPAASNKNPMKKKKEKPAWAQTQQQVEQQQTAQQNQLLNFFQTTDVEEFINDTEVTTIMKVLKDKIDAIKKEEGWKEKQTAKAQQQERLARKQEQEQAEKQTRSEAGSKASEGNRSVASEKSTKRIEELKDKLEKKQQGIAEEWDKSSKASKPGYSNLEDRIAKNVADQVLRSYGLFKGVHSNNSVRKLLEREAARQLVQPHPRPIITTIVKEKTALDMNNLPYLHRNPAV